MSVCLFICLSSYLSVYSSIFPSICFSFHPSVFLSVFPSIGSIVSPSTQFAYTQTNIYFTWAGSLCSFLILRLLQRHLLLLSSDTYIPLYLQIRNINIADAGHITRTSIYFRNWPQLSLMSLMKGAICLISMKVNVSSQTNDFSYNWSSFIFLCQCSIIHYSGNCSSSCLYTYWA